MAGDAAGAVVVVVRGAECYLRDARLAVPFARLLSLLRPFAVLPPPLAFTLLQLRNVHHGTGGGAQRGLLELKDRMVQTGADQIVQKLGLWGRGRRGLIMLVGQKRRRGARSCIRECRGWWYRGTTFTLRSSSLLRGDRQPIFKNKSRQSKTPLETSRFSREKKNRMARGVSPPRNPICCSHVRTASTLLFQL